MPTKSPIRQNLRVRDAQMELETDNFVGDSALSNDVIDEIEAAKKKLEKLEAEKIRIENQRIELAEINELKETFLDGQKEMEEKLSTALTAIDRGITSTKQETEELVQTKTTFTEHLNKINSLNPETWKQDRLRSELDRAISTIQFAEDEYDNALDILSQKEQNNAGYNEPSSVKKHTHAHKEQFLSGLAFNLPLILFGSLAFVLYLLFRG